MNEKVVITYEFIVVVVLTTKKKWLSDIYLLQLLKR